MAIESSYPEPPPNADRLAVQGLRGGAAVLMVAAFEEFVKQALLEHLEQLTRAEAKVCFDRLPTRVQTEGVFLALNNALKGPAFVKTEKSSRLPTIRKTAGLVAAGVLDPAAFVVGFSNPRSDRVRSLFKSIDIQDIFASIQAGFEKLWDKPEANTFLRDKLDEIVDRRHKVAHTANVLDIGREDLKDAAKFLRALAQLLDDGTARQVRKLLKMST